MLKKSFENIDNRASIPKEIAFNKALYWDRIQKIPVKNPPTYWVWVAASFILLAASGVWLFLGSYGHQPQYLTTQISHDSQMNMEIVKISKPSSIKIYFEDSNEIKIAQSHTRHKTDTLIENDTAKHSITNMQRRPSIASFILNEKDEVIQEQKPLSPSADALKKALANTKKEVPKEEKPVFEKLTFEKAIQARKNYFMEKGNQGKSKKDNE
ncbi:hypothetical protein MMU07_11275 [Aquiflexum sp. LQ15W]|uniref:hypothetical protein n=1 Tax=Cognataquiflexum nitidum TaxID=2922272 RepID=UPI001F142F7C|nr:hypothetical protein [Cognataquiflexum nitidum]MCH6200167.1 hypothetical protein [Cognataquiflexum nitidum]